MNKKIIGILLAVCLIVTAITAVDFTATAAKTAPEPVGSVEEITDTAANYHLASRLEDGNILHCFNWTLNQIKAELPNIAAAGFTGVQTSPLQPHDGSYNWYWLYQPSNSTIGNDLGSYDDLKSLCTEAHKYGIKVVVDAVANHLAGDKHGQWAGCIDGSWRNGDYFHNMGECTNYDNRFDVTHKNIGMPDLNSEHTEVQKRFVDMATGLKSAGVDGVRWDAAKHIGLPSENCEFWPKIAAVGMFNYGEILDNPAGSSGDDYNKSLINEYAQYIGVTDSSYSGHITGCIRDNKMDGWNANWANKGVPADHIVYWAESHDTYCNNGWTNSLSEDVIDRAYAILGARANSQSLYFSRPFEHNHDSICYGVKGSTHYTSKQVAAVNHFHNAMVGTGEYFSVENGCFIVCRGGGVVIVSPHGSDFDITVTNGNGLVPNGTYTDEVSGSTWYVNGSSISGHIGSTGIAVIYNQPAASPSVYANPGNSTYKTDTISVTLGYSNATSGSYSIDGGSFKSFSNGQTITIGSGVKAGTSTTLVVKATNGSSTDQATYTYTKIDPNAAQTVYFNNNYYNWSDVYVYIYADNNGNIISNGEWPGKQMTKSSNNIYTYDVPFGLGNGRVIFTENSGNNDHRYPGDGDPGMDLNNNSMIFGDNRSWTVYTGQVVPSTQPPSQHQTQPPTQPPTQRPTQPPTPTGKYMVGDADMSGDITILDATAIQRDLASLSRLKGNAVLAGDADRDGKLSILDATAIQRYLVKLPTSKQIGTYVGSTPVNPTEPPVNPTQPPVQPTQPPVSSDSVILNASATSAAPEAWYAWTWNDGEGRWVKGSGDVSAIVFNNLDSHVIFVRANPELDVDWNNGSVWNQTTDLNVEKGKTFTTSGWSAKFINGDWN